MSALLSIYERLPWAARQAVWTMTSRILARQRYNVGFQCQLAEALALDFVGGQRIAEVVKSQLESLSQYSTIDNPPDGSVDDLDLWVANGQPVTEKSEMLRQFANRPKVSGQQVVRTSGSTGQTFAVAQSRSTDNRKWATWWRHWIRHGVQPHSWSLHLGGRNIVGRADQRPRRSFIVDHAQRRTYVSQYHLDPSRVSEWVAIMNRHKIQWLHGYPSTTTEFISLLHSTGAISELHEPIRFVTVSSETLTAAQVTQVKDVLGLQPIEHFGMAEGAVSLSVCAAGRFHSDDDFALFHKNPSGELRGTNLWNTVMPFINYRTGDAYIAIEECSCGSPFRAVASRVDGRLDDYLLLPDGRKVGRLDHIFKHVLGLRRAQIWQLEPGLIEVHVELEIGGDFHSVSKSICTSVAGLYGSSVHVGAVILGDIEVGPNGKMRMVIAR